MVHMCVWVCSKISATQLGRGSVDRAIEAVLKFLPDRCALRGRAAKVSCGQERQQSSDRVHNEFHREGDCWIVSRLKESGGNRTVSLREGMGGWGRCGPRR